MPLTLDAWRTVYRCRTTAVLTLLLALVLLALLISAWRLYLARQTLQAWQTQVQQLNAQIQHASAQRQILQQLQPQRQAYLDAGIIGPAQRLQWLQSLQRLTQHYRIPQVAFKLLPTEPDWDDAHLDHNGQPSRNQTPMTLLLTLMHEGDFYHLLTQLRAQTPGAFQVNDCVLRTAVFNDDGRLGKLMSGECELLWFNYNDLAYPSS